MEWYTQQEVANLLGISKATVYHYAKQKKIKKISDPHRLHREARYEKAEVDTLLEERKSYPSGMRPAEVAKQLGVSVQSIYKYIQEGVIQAEEVPFGDERITYVISEAAFQDAAQLLKPSEAQRPKRNEYYNSTHDIVLFQQFRSTKIPEARVVRNQENEWGFYLANNQRWLSYGEGVSDYLLKPTYSIHQSMLDYKGYVQLELPKDAVVFYPLLDYLYETWGMENVRLREQNHSILLFIRAGEKPLTTQAFTLSDILPFLQEGEIHMEEEKLLIRSAYRKTSLELPIELLDNILQKAEQEGISMSQWVERALSLMLK